MRPSVSESVQRAPAPEPRAALSELAEAEVPAGFADRVMVEVQVERRMRRTHVVLAATALAGWALVVNVVVGWGLAQLQGVL